MRDATACGPHLAHLPAQLLAHFYGLVCTTTVELSSCGRDSLAHKASSVYYLGLYRKSLNTPGLPKGGGSAEVLEKRELFSRYTQPARKVMSRWVWLSQQRGGEGCFLCGCCGIGMVCPRIHLCVLVLVCMCTCVWGAAPPLRGKLGSQCTFAEKRL